MSTKRCYYETLEVTKGCDGVTLKSAYRKLAMKFHPDKNPDDHTAEIKFKEINEAYDVLKDDQKRAAYDRFGHAAFEGGMGAAGGARGGNPFGDFGSFGDVFEDIFGQMMGGMGRGKRSNRGQDLRYNLEITLEEAFTGRSAEIKVPTMLACEACTGSGAEPGTSAETCPGCAGHGKVRATQGFFTIERSCSQCRGSGKVIRNPCKTCKGAGLVQKERTLTVDVPPGVEEGTRIRLSGEGAAGSNGGPNGDLYIFLSVAEHPIFQRDGHDLHCRAPVSFVTAALGGAIEVPTLDGGRSRVAIPEGTQPGRQFRLRGKGMPVLRSAQKGDLYVELAVETPVKLTKRQKELLREFDGESQAGTHPEAEGFLARLKEFWNGGV
ncbi:MAG TPA: molecular chaperone DnaJ [Rhizomicrobium sp.]|jgi:molecular chaperone DnaJ|nr:molecular chaperone DnaJ [Rhizomicrobium sp.]